MEFINIIITGVDTTLVSTFIESAGESRVIKLKKKFSADFPYQEMELGHIKIDRNQYLFLIGTPLADSYKVIWQRAAKDLAGLIIIVNSNDSKNKIEKAKTLIDKLASLGLPYLVVFNDIKKAGELKKLQQKLKLVAGCPQINISVRNKDAAKQGILSEIGRAHV